MTNFFLDGVGIIVGKGVDSVNQHFLHLPQNFQKHSYQGSWHCVGLKLANMYVKTYSKLQVIYNFAMSAFCCLLSNLI